MLASILSSLFSRVGIYLISGLLIAGTIGGGYLYVKHLKSENAILTRQLEGYRRAMKILKEDAKITAETEDEKEAIDLLNPDEFADYFKRLRERARGRTSPDTE